MRAKIRRMQDQAQQGKMAEADAQALSNAYRQVIEM
jgi:hypothetical protein